MKINRWAERYQRHYDLEIEEGMSSGLVRFVTVDVTHVFFFTRWLFWVKLVQYIQDFNMCRYTLLMDVTIKGKRYFVFDGECHLLYSHSTTSIADEHVKLVMPQTAKVVKYIRVKAPQGISYTKKAYEPMTAHLHHK